MGLLIDKVRNIISRDAEAEGEKMSKKIPDPRTEKRDRQIADIIINSPSISVSNIAKKLNTSTRTVYDSINRQELKSKRTHKEGIMIACTSCGKQVYRNIARVFNNEYYCSNRCARTFDAEATVSAQKWATDVKKMPVVSVQCSYCSQWFDRDRAQYNAAVKRGQKLFFCNKQHSGEYKSAHPETFAKELKRKKPQDKEVSVSDNYPVDTTDFNRLFSSLAASSTEFNIVTPWSDRSSIDVSFVCNITLEELNMANVNMIRDVILGPPQVTDPSIVEDLQNLGIYGLYTPIVTER